MHELKCILICISFQFRVNWNWISVYRFLFISCTGWTVCFNTMMKSIISPQTISRFEILSIGGMFQQQAQTDVFGQHPVTKWLVTCICRVYFLIILVYFFLDIHLLEAISSQQICWPGDDQEKAKVWENKCCNIYIKSPFVVVVVIVHCPLVIHQVF